MFNLFLETAPTLSELIGAGGGGAVLAIIAGAIIAALLIGLVLWVYCAFAYMAIAKKAKQKSPAIAWIPFVGPLIIAYKASKMPWWPWLFLIGYLIPVIGWIAVIAFWVFAVIWHWKLFEAIGKPGWWSILLIIPIVNLVIIGIAALSKK